MPTVTKMLLAEFGTLTLERIAQGWENKAVKEEDELNRTRLKGAAMILLQEVARRRKAA